jgi:uncharacterized integral membrane protein
MPGVAFKEGMCYGKAEAAALFGATPLLLLGHLSGAVPADGGFVCAEWVVVVVLLLMLMLMLLMLLLLLLLACCCWPFLGIRLGT